MCAGRRAGTQGAFKSGCPAATADVLHRVASRCVGLESCQGGVHCSNGSHALLRCSEGHRWLGSVQLTARASWQTRCAVSHRVRVHTKFLEKAVRGVAACCAVMQHVRPCCSMSHSWCNINGRDMCGFLATCAAVLQHARPCCNMRGRVATCAAVLQHVRPCCNMCDRVETYAPAAFRWRRRRRHLLSLSLSSFLPPSPRSSAGAPPRRPPRCKLRIGAHACAG